MAKRSKKDRSAGKSRKGARTAAVSEVEIEEVGKSGPTLEDGIAFAAFLGSAAAAVIVFMTNSSYYGT